MEPEEVYGLCEMDRRAKMADLVWLEEYQALGPIDRLRELAEADNAGRCDVCKHYSALAEPRERSDGATIYGYCFQM